MKIYDDIHIEPLDDLVCLALNSPGCFLTNFEMTFTLFCSSSLTKELNKSMVIFQHLMHKAVKLYTGNREKGQSEHFVPLSGFMGK